MKLRSAASRWKQTSQVTGVDRQQPGSQLFAALMYFSGFKAGIEASAEIARLPRRDVPQAHAALQEEVDAFHQLAAVALADGDTPH